MTPSQLYDGILKAMNDKEAIDLIEQAKSEWEDAMVEKCIKKFLSNDKDDKWFLNDMKTLLNAPEPFK